MSPRSPFRFNLRRRFDGNGSKDNGIHSPGSFLKVMEKERDRTDRTGLDLSLLIFSAAGGNGNLDPLYSLSETLQKRVRITDEIGWYREGRLGVALPHTPLSGAQGFVEGIRESMPGFDEGYRFEIVTYPNGHKDDAGGNGKSETGEDEKVLEKISPNRKGLPLWKRALDVAGSLAGLILLSPLFFVISLLIKITSPGPVLFKQERVGHLGKLYIMLKFRSMHVDAGVSTHEEYLGELIGSDKEMEKLDEKDDPRIFTFGKILRKSCLDELPQLVNVLKGDMSLVGPRPCLPYEAEKYLRWNEKRFDSVPGLTGLWQVSGKNQTTFKEMIRLDIRYTRNLSLINDLMIIAKTVPTVLSEAFARSNGKEERVAKEQTAH